MKSSAYRSPVNSISYTHEFLKIPERIFYRIQIN